MLVKTANKLAPTRIPIPKEAPWKTSALNEPFRKKRNSEFSTATSGTERKRGFVGIGILVGANLSLKHPPILLLRFYLHSFCNSNFLSHINPFSHLISIHIPFSFIFPSNFNRAPSSFFSCSHHNFRILPLHL